MVGSLRKSLRRNPAAEVHHSLGRGLERAGVVEHRLLDILLELQEGERTVFGIFRKIFRLDRDDDT